MNFWIVLLIAVLALMLLASGGVVLWARLRHPLPKGPFAHSGTLPPRPELAARFAPNLDDHPDENALNLLEDPALSLAARLELIEAAQDGIDLQYYDWMQDTAGALMLSALRRAGARGVRIRLLLDDNSTAGRDHLLTALRAIPGLELRLFNPFPLRRLRFLAYLADFTRLNRRMHNKAMIVDGAIAILGGRNVGDDYFNTLGPRGLYMDLDFAIAGPLLEDLARVFDSYWNAPLSVPAEAILPPGTPWELEAALAHEATLLSHPEAVNYGKTLAELHREGHLLGPGATPRQFAPVELVYDPPGKPIQTRLRRKEMLWTRMRRALGQPTSELLILSPYFVPMRSGVRLLARIAKAGVKLRIVTNSFAATDVALVHSGYAHRRRALLRNGAELYEFAPDAVPTLDVSALLKSRLHGTAPFSRNKLHAKVFIVDRDRLFLGSFNFDPRSIRLNTELGVIVHSPVIAGMIADRLDALIPERCWHVTLSRTQRLSWERPGEAPRHTEPGATWPARIALGIARRLPIEWML